MAPEKTIAKQLGAMRSHIRGHSEERGDDEQGEFTPPLNQEGAANIDIIVGIPSCEETSFASGSASATKTRVTRNPRDGFIIQQSAQQEQLKQLF